MARAVNIDDVYTLFEPKNKVGWCFDAPGYSFSWN